MNKWIKLYLWWLAAAHLGGWPSTSQSRLLGHCSGVWSPGRTRRTRTDHQWWLSLASLARFQDAPGCPDKPACADPSGHHSAASAPSLRRLSAYPEYSVIIFQMLSRFMPSSFCDQSNSQPTITTHHLPQSCRLLLVEGLLFVGLSLTSSRPSLKVEPLVPLKSTRTWHCLISMHLLHYTQCFWQSFPQPDKKFQVGSLLCAHPSLDDLKQRTYKSMWKTVLIWRWVPYAYDLRDRPFLKPSWLQPNDSTAYHWLMKIITS